MHPSLQPKANKKLLLIWGLVASTVGFVASPVPRIFLAVGSALGVFAGVIQLRALRESASALLAAQTLIEVRRALKLSRNGRRYLFVFWTSMIVLLVMAFGLRGSHAPVALLAGYSAFAFMREALTLRGGIELQKISLKRTA